MAFKGASVVSGPLPSATGAQIIHVLICDRPAQCVRVCVCMSGFLYAVSCVCVCVCVCLCACVSVYGHVFAHAFMSLCVFVV